MGIHRLIYLFVMQVEIVQAQFARSTDWNKAGFVYFMVYQ